MTNRHTIGRRPARRITPEAIAIFRKMLVLQESCTCDQSDDDKYFKSERCPACAQWWQENMDLTGELRLKLWEFPAYENPALDSEAGHKPDPDAIARYHALRAAADKAAKNEKIRRR